MNKKSIAILFVASCFASSAFANSIVSKLITKQSSATPSMTKTHKLTKQANQSYTDFSGTWVGNCDNFGEMTTEIENGANYISFDGDESRIGKGLQGKYQANEEETGYEHTSLEWNADGSLMMRGVDVMKDNKDNSSIQTVVYSSTLTMKNGQINLDAKATGFEDVTQMQQPFTLHCVFSKKQQ